MKPYSDKACHMKAEFYRITEGKRRAKSNCFSLVSLFVIFLEFYNNLILSIQTVPQVDLTL